MTCFERFYRNLERCHIRVHVALIDFVEPQVAEERRQLVIDDALLCFARCAPLGPRRYAVSCLIALLIERTSLATLPFMRASWCLVLVAACGSSSAPAGSADAPDVAVTDWSVLCAKHHRDPVSKNFCDGGYRPAIGSLADLENLLDIRIQTTKASLTGLSTGVGLRSVTPLNPRLILMREDPAEQIGPVEVLSFARGEPLVELIGEDQAADTLRFFVVQFHPSCEQATGGCTPGDLLTPAVEENWTGYSIYDEDALANTVLDCNTCHQPDGPGTHKIMRMQELALPWEHWFRGGPNVQLFERAHANETTYGGRLISDELGASPGSLEQFVLDHGYGPQPNAFDTSTIEGELAGSGTSATWQGLYENAITGQAIPPPYYGPDQTDPTRVAAFVDTYLAVSSGAAPASSLPETRSLFLDAVLPLMSIRPAAGLDGRGTLIHVCSQCHNSRLDQSLSRARFNVMTLDTMSRQEKNLAITRLQLPDDDPGKMPPPRFRTLSSDELGRVIDTLAQ